jgi:hypothetical protein
MGRYTPQLNELVLMAKKIQPWRNVRASSQSHQVVLADGTKLYCLGMRDDLPPICKVRTALCFAAVPSHGHKAKIRRWSVRDDATCFSFLITHEGGRFTIEGLELSSSNSCELVLRRAGKKIVLQMLV